MAFSWDHQIEKAEIAKKRRDKCKALQNPSFLAKIGVKKGRKILDGV